MSAVTRVARAISLSLVGLMAACGNDTEGHHEAVTCEADQQVGGVCVGVPSATLCSDDTCTDGVECASVVEATTDAEVTAALATAGAGDCLALAPGAYAQIDLPAGLSLLGRSAADVTVQGVTLGAGTGEVLRGLTVQTGGIVVDGARDARIESVRVDRSTGDGIALLGAASATIVTSEITGSGR
jgi:hypothetical protein